MHIYIYIFFSHSDFKFKYFAVSIYLIRNLSSSTLIAFHLANTGASRDRIKHGETTQRQLVSQVV